MKRKTTTERVLTLLGKGKRARTKDEIAEALGASHSRVSQVVNMLVNQGVLAVKGSYKPETGRPAPKYGRA